MSVHHHTVRVYWEDTDAGGIVYHANYLKFAERGRSEFVRSVGIVQSDLAQRGFVFAVTGIAIRFLRPARLDDLLDVQTQFTRMGGVRLALRQQIRRKNTTDEEKNEDIAELDVELAYMSLDGRPARIPTDIRELLSSPLCPVETYAGPNQQ